MRYAAIAVALSVAFTATTQAQKFTPKAPTDADWAALAKLPDFTGVWEAGFGGPAPGRGGANGAPPARGAAPPAPPAAGAAPVPGRGAGGGRGRAGGPSLTPAYAEKQRANRAKGAEDSATANCLPPGMPGIMGQPYPMEFLLTPGLVTIVIEAYSQVRHIYTDGRPLPEDPDLKFFGTSVGHWENGTLVVDTVGFSLATEIANGAPHSDKMKISERFSLSGPDSMTIETTVTDPEALTAPFTSTRTLQRHRTWTIAEYICEENNRNYMDQNGKAGINIKKD